MSTNTQSLKSLWQSLPAEEIVFSHEQMQQLAHQFQAKHKRRALTEYLGFAALFGLTAYYLTLRADWQAFAASGLVIIGGIIMLWNYLRIAKVNALPSSNSSETTLEYMRRELTRQRDAAASAWKWYILPCVPFLIFVLAFRWSEEGATLTELTDFRVIILFVFAFIVASLLATTFWYFLNAARYQRQLDALDKHTRS
ncbi:MAG: hypothetical protein ABJN69_04025 [Hellea sp.]